MLRRLLEFGRHSLGGQPPVPAEIELEELVIASAVAPLKRPLVLAIVSNPARNDSRVLKQAKSLIAAGYEVLIYAAHHPDLPNEETWQGIKFRRFTMFDLDVAVSASSLSRALALFGPEADLVRDKFFSVVSLKAIADDADTAFQKARRFTKSLPSVDPRKEDAKASLERAKYFRLQTAIDFKKGLKQEFVYIKHLLFTLNCLSHGLNETPALIHSHDLYPLAVATFFAQQTDARIVYDAHELESERMPVMNADEKRFIESIENHLIKQCDAMATVCPSIAEIYKGRTGKVPAVIYNSPDTRVSVETTFGMRDAIGLQEGVPLIAYTGNVGREGRGLHLVLEALVHVPEFHLAVLGPRHVANDKWLTDYAERVGVDLRVHLLPPVDADQVIHATKGADVGICPIQDASLSYRFSMPNKLFEMALSGLPIAVSDLPEMRAFVEANGIGLAMNQTEPKSIAETIQTIYDKRGQYRLDDAGLKDMIVRYCWQAQEKTLLDLYEKTLH